MKIGAIIQARMGSRRLPGKTLAPIEGYPMLWHVLERVRRSTYINHIILATTSSSQDDVLADFGRDSNVEVVRGDEFDVLDRFHRAAVMQGVETIVRITPDCPLHDPKVIDFVISEYFQHQCDYASNTINYTFPEGLDVEVFSKGALERAWKEASKHSDREHVTTYIRNNPNHFRIQDIRGPYQCGRLHWSVDEPADLEFVRAVYRDLYGKDPCFGLKDVLTLLREKPELAEFNAGVEINAGYQTSLRTDVVPGHGLCLDKSLEYLGRAEQVIPGSSQTFSKGWTQFSRGVNPVFVEEAEGCVLTDVDGNRYIDYSMALCPVILGYKHPVVNDAISSQLQKGISFSLPHRLEVELAEELVRLIPCAEMVQFGKNGSDATSAAVRVARAYTGRDQVICCGYHGWHDWFIGTTTRSGGVPRAIQALSHSVPYNDLGAVETLLSSYGNDVAAIILEPVGVLPPNPGYLQGLQELARRDGVILIFDEIITGFRMHLGGAQSFFGVTPDLAAFGKSMGNGMPIAAVVGRRDIMAFFNEIFFSTTFGGETLSLAASVATISFLEREQVLAVIWERGRVLKEGVAKLIGQHNLEGVLDIQGYPPRTVLNCLPSVPLDPLIVKSFLQQECASRGLFFSGAHNLSLAHTKEIIRKTIQIYDQVFTLLADAIRQGDDMGSRLRGEVVRPVFRKA